MTTVNHLNHIHVPKKEKEELAKLQGGLWERGKAFWANSFESICNIINMKHACIYLTSLK